MIRPHLWDFLRCRQSDSKNDQQVNFEFPRLLRASIMKIREFHNNFFLFRFSPLACKELDGYVWEGGFETISRITLDKFVLQQAKLSKINTPRQARNNYCTFGFTVHS